METADFTPVIRELYEEFPDGDERIVLISDPETTDAWIQSDTTVDIVR